jgi:D-alanyl-D-alanine carboxypeptidase (penicillin-binding protein 5/6)
VLVDITDNKAIAGRNADTRIYPASMTKVMTLLVACENAKDPNKLLTLTDEMVEKYNKVKGSDAKGPSLELVWKVGYQVSVEDALHMVIYGSDTYACWLLADYIAGSEEQFVELMNAKAVELGLTNTHYANATGLFDENHYTTCREMAAVMAAAMNNEAAKKIITTIKEYPLEVYIGGEKDEDASSGMWNNWYAGRIQKHPFVSSSGAKATIYVGNGSDVKFMGGKTGYETIPSYCFVTAGENDTTGRQYVVVQVGRVDSTQPTIDVKTSTADTRAMYYKYAKEE